MKKLIYISAALALIFALGCTPSQEPEDVPPPPKAPEQEPESAKKIVEDYGEGLVSSMDRAKTAQARVDIREVQRGVQEYALEHDGAYPASLDEVKPYITGGIDLSPFDYNPSNGTLRIR